MNIRCSHPNCSNIAVPVNHWCAEHTPVPSADVKKVLEWVRSEVTCGKLLKPERLMTPEERAWTGAHDRCLSIISNYAEGFGLYQMTEKIKSR